ncbi:hypothetical protein CULT_1620004 [[Clostridium] ultunense Esp]|nr:hypothetical protein CULT_1620004 [[Clostridium] ultunense Esp]
MNSGRKKQGSSNQIEQNRKAHTKELISWSVQKIKEMGKE